MMQENYLVSFKLSFGITFLVLNIFSFGPFEKLHVLSLITFQPQGYSCVIVKFNEGALKLIILISEKFNYHCRSFQEFFDIVVNDLACVPFFMRWPGTLFIRLVKTSDRNNLQLSFQISKILCSVDNCIRI